MIPNILFFLIVTGALFMSTSCSANNDFTDYKSPYFSMEFTAKRLGIEIRVNDVPVFYIENTGFMTLEVPVSQYILNGQNTITVITHPIFDDDDEQQDEYIDGASIDVGLYIREDDQASSERRLISKTTIIPGNSYIDALEEATATFVYPLTKPEYSIQKDAELLKYPLYGNLKKQVIVKWVIRNLASSFPRWQWQDGKDIIKSESSHQSLIKAYTILHNAFIEKDMGAIKKISSQRSSELKIAYHLIDDDAGFEHSALGKYVNHPTVKLYEKVFLEHTKFEVFGKGKLARIMDGAQTHPIVFIDDETEQLYQAQFKWYLNKNNEWILIR